MPKSHVKARNNACICQSGRCYYCKGLMATGDISQFAKQHGLSECQARRRQCTAEHLHARCDGGTNCRTNIVAACWHCNKLLHARSNALAPSAYKSFVQKRFAQGRWHSAYVFKLGLI